MFAPVPDPVRSGLVASLNRPGGNVTGIAAFTIELDPKRLELLHQLTPSNGPFGVLLNPSRPDTQIQVAGIESAARSVGRELVLGYASSVQQVDAAFANFADRTVVGLLVAADPFFTSQRIQVVVLASRHRWPAIYQWREFAEHAGLQVTDRTFLICTGKQVWMLRAFSRACAAKVRFALGEKNLARQGHYLDILKGDQFAPEYRKLNSKAVVPTLVHDGNVIVEFTVINEYIDETFPDVPLKPRAAVERAEMRLWTKAVDENLHPACGEITFASCHRHIVRRLPEDKFQQFLNSTPPISVTAHWHERKRKSSCRDSTHQGSVRRFVCMTATSARWRVRWSTGRGLQARRSRSLTLR